jgi:hypothetical protein
MIAANSVSSGVSCVPPPCGRTRDGGINGSAISHKPSGTIQLHVPRPMFSSTSHNPHRTRSYSGGWARQWPHPPHLPQAWELPQRQWLLPGRRI